jgi:hypothetical protein
MPIVDEIMRQYRRVECQQRAVPDMDATRVGAIELGQARDQDFLADVHPPDLVEIKSSSIGAKMVEFCPQARKKL